MKKILILMLVLLLSACSKSSDSTSTEFSSDIYGKWELFKEYNEYGGNRFEGTENDKHDTYEFNKPNTFRENYRNLDYPNDDSKAIDASGTFTYIYDVLTVHTIIDNGIANEYTNVYYDVIIENGILTCKFKIGQDYPNPYQIQDYRIFYFKKIN